ncbi:PEP-CTERM sorting domain-containing protein [Rubritalea tangerina]|uniref:PEP-CTERM sorting domain-containing protein n=1 Tax=Rubritalea tangerina TaxID=430798 RepID=A0ABW4ZEG4_9BACT
MKKSKRPSTAGMILAGGLMFAGAANAATLFTEDFEGDSSKWQSSWGTYNSSDNFSGDAHSSVTDGLTKYGNLIGGAGATTNAAPVVSTTVVLEAGEIAAAALGNANYDFSGWLASYTGNAEVTQISVEFFSDTGATNSLGTVLLADGNVEGTSTTPAGAWNNKNWSNYTASGQLATGTQSFQITYGTSGGNDAYADNLSFSVSTSVAVPEPSSTLLLGLGGVAMILRRRR